MSIQHIKLQRLQNLKNKLNNSEKFQFSENMKAIFQSEQDTSKFEYLSEAKKEMSLEPIIIGSTTIKPIMMRDPEEPMPQAMNEDTDMMESSQRSIADISSLLVSLESISISNTRNEILRNLIGLPLNELRVACQSINFSDWSEEIISDLCNEIEKKNTNISNDCTSLLVHSTIYTKVRIVKNISSRILISNINILSKSHGKAIVQGLIIPILFETNTERLHVDMLEKLITKTLGPDNRLYLLDCILKQNQAWSDHIIQVIGFVLDTEPLVELDGIKIRGIIQNVAQVIQGNPKDKGSIRLFFTLAKKYQNDLIRESLIDSMEQTAKQSKNMMSKSLINQLNQIRKK